MTKEKDNQSAFAGLNLSNARGEDETYEQYKSRLRQNNKIMKLYNTIGRDGFKEMFPKGVHEALESNAEEIHNELKEYKESALGETHELAVNEKTPQEELGEAK